MQSAIGVSTMRENAVGKVVRPRAFSQSETARADSTEALPCPQARHLGELITAKQIQISGRLGDETGTDCNLVAGELFDCEVGELSRPAAEVLIEVLENKAKDSRFRQQLRLTG